MKKVKFLVNTFLSKKGDVTYVTNRVAEIFLKQGKIEILQDLVKED